MIVFQVASTLSTNKEAISNATIMNLMECSMLAQDER